MCAHDESHWPKRAGPAPKEGQSARPEPELSALDKTFLTSVYDQSNVLMLALDPGGRIVRFNAACERASGYAFDEVRGRVAWEFLMVGDDAEIVRHRIVDVDAADFPQDGENYWLAKDGHRLFTSWSNSAIVDARGAVELIVSTGIDITDRLRNEEALERARKDAERSRGFLDAMLENVPAAVFAKDARDLTHVLSSKLHRELVDRDASEIMGEDDYAIFPSDRASEYQAVDRRAIAERQIVEAEEMVDHPTRGEIVVHSRKVPVLDEHGEPQILLGIAVDITERKRGERALAAKATELERSKRELARSEERFRSLVQNASDVIIVVKADGTLTFQTPSMRSVLGYEPKELADTQFIALVHHDDVAAVGDFLSTATTGDDLTETLDVRVRHNNGSWLHVEIVGRNLLRDPTVGGIVLTIRDVTERIALQHQLAHQAFHDDLTGLANRALFVNRIEHVFSRRQGYDNVAIIYLDFDDFKTINDSLGHSAGDELLVEFAARLRTCLRTGDTCARLGGDEFAILVEDAPDPRHAEHIAERIVELLDEPFSIAGTELFGRASIGIAMPGKDLKSAEELLRNADLAMYRAKREGTAGSKLFDPSMHVDAVARLEPGRMAGIGHAQEGGAGGRC